LPQKGNIATLPQKGNIATLPQKGNIATLPQKGNIATLPQKGNTTTLPQKHLAFIRLGRSEPEHEKVLAIFSSGNNAVGKLSLQRPPPASDGVVISLVSRFTRR
jgi:hypothetical protein